MAEPLRILQIVAKMERNGYESRIMDIYRNLDRNKVQFDFYTHRKEKGDFDDEIISLGGRIYYNNPISPFSFFRYLHDLNVFFKNHHYDVVHAHLNSYCAYALWAAKRNGVPVRIAHSRNTGIDPGWKSIFKYASKIFINFPPTHRFACSRNAGIWLFGDKFTTEKNSKVIPNAFNCTAFAYNPTLRQEVRDELGLHGEDALVSVGRFSPPKNHQAILSIFKAYKRLHTDSKLFLFGEGELKEQIRTMAKEAAIDEAVFFMGNKPNVYRYLNGMDAMLFPSIYEGFGTVALEAQCNGLPVLASDVLPVETRITDLIRYRSLKSPIEDWVRDLSEMIASNTRADASQQLKDAGYDMEINAVNMQNFYLHAAKLTL